MTRHCQVDAGVGLPNKMAPANSLQQIIRGQPNDLVKKYQGRPDEPAQKYGQAKLASLFCAREQLSDVLLPDEDAVGSLDGVAGYLQKHISGTKQVLCAAVVKNNC